ncbi:hypothetical protein B0T26DRAFT_722569 [Lasiosphaeria miniovina]|uniref:Uncharacterized protein n=1 Tax=Lasiosphaeria miniovina TaxID=1954250 RepID=A0AA40A5N8_9PEZI|nr:uncharacterized protein B0T26DRAFT_722569 [Lasiosphaeria miniovina]KAK0709690.1 hypothetical protein B0T26DRAFT_722569 [Lasiosphaeria miniovina]
MATDDGGAMFPGGGGDGDRVKFEPSMLNSIFTAPSLPFWALASGFTNQWYQTQISDAVRYAAMAIHRPLDVREARAIAEHTATGFHLQATYEPPIWIASAWFMERRYRATLRLPFWRPDPAKYNISSFPSIAKPTLVGPQARLAWIAMRFIVYGGVTHYAITGPLIFFWGRAVTMAGFLGDEDLQEFREKLKMHQAQRAGGFIPGMGEMPQKPQQDEEEGATYSSYGGASEVTSAPAPRKSAWQARWENTQRQKQEAEVRRRTQDDDDADLFNDASLVAPSAPPAAASSAPQTGSAWEKLRKNPAAEAGASQSWAARRQQQQQQNSTKDDEYVYSTQERNTASEKEKAQREFDAMLERERSGQGSNSNNRRF